MGGAQCCEPEPALSDAQLRRLQVEASRVEVGRSCDVRALALGKAAVEEPAAWVEVLAVAAPSCPEPAAPKPAPPRATPRLTAALLVLHWGAFAAACARTGRFAALEVNPCFGPEPAELLRLGALQRDLVFAGAYWRLAAAPLLQAGVAQLAVSSAGLGAAGAYLEAEHGSARVALLYVSTLLLGGLGSALATPLASVGPGGAVCGLLGAAVRQRSREHPPGFVLHLVLALLLGLLPLVDNYGQLTGLLAGSLLGGSLDRPGAGLVACLGLGAGLAALFLAGRFADCRLCVELECYDARWLAGWAAWSCA